MISGKLFELFRVIFSQNFVEFFSPRAPILLSRSLSFFLLFFLSSLNVIRGGEVLTRLRVLLLRVRTHVKEETLASHAFSTCALGVESLDGCVCEKLQKIGLEKAIGQRQRRVRSFGLMSNLALMTAFLLVKFMVSQGRIDNSKSEMEYFSYQRLFIPWIKA